VSNEPLTRTRAWRTIRAGLITLVLVVGLIAGLPVPMSGRAAERRPQLARFAAHVAEIQGHALAPFQFVGRIFGVGQRWKLFSGVTSARYRMWLEARRENGDFELLYRSHDPEHAFLQRVLEQRRVRGVWNPQRGAATGGYPGFARWISRQVLECRPEFSAVRVRMEQIEILPRGRGFEPTGRFAYEALHGREEAP
jgi:hypothetical protein